MGVARGTGTAEQCLEKVAEIGFVCFRETATRELETLVPVRRGLEILTGLPIGAELVIGDAFFRVLENFVGLAGFLEFLFRVGFLVDVRVQFARKFAIGTLDLVLRRRPLQPQPSEVVSVMLGCTMAPTPRMARVLFLLSW